MAAFFEILGMTVAVVVACMIGVAIYELCAIAFRDCWHDWDVWIDQSNKTQVRWCKKCNKAELRKP